MVQTKQLPIPKFLSVSNDWSVFSLLAFTCNSQAFPFLFHQIIANKSLAIPLRELKRLIRKRLGEARDMIGYDIAALKVIARVAHERKLAMAPIQENPVDIWAGLGLGSDVAAALQSRSRKR